MTHYEETELSPKLLPDEIVQSDIPRKDNGIIEGEFTTLMENYECDLLRKVLSSHNWNKSAAARALNISEAVIRYKIKRLKISSPQK